MSEAEMKAMAAEVERSIVADGDPFSGTDWSAVQVARWALQLASQPDDLLAACKLWDQGFTEGEEFTPEQFRVWVNKNRAAARAAIAKAEGH